MDGIPATTAALGYPQGIALDSGGNLYISDNFNSRIRRVDINTGLISTYAGSGIGDGFGEGSGIGFDGDGAAATSALLNGPYGIAFDSQDNLYIADSNNSRIRRVDRQSQIISTIAGGGLSGIGNGGYGGDGLVATNSQVLLNVPQGVWVDGNETVYIADSDNNRIRKVSGGIISTLAGTGDPGVLNSPLAVWANSSGSLVLAADTQNSVLRNITGGSLTVVAGNGSDGSSGDGSPLTQASFDGVLDIASDGAGNLFILDGPSATLRKINSIGVLSTVVSIPAAALPPGCEPDCFSITGMAADSSGNVYISDQEYGIVLKVDSQGNVTTLAGQVGQAVWGGDGGPASSATFAGPYGLAVDSVHGYLYVADQGSPGTPSHIRRIALTANPPTITSVAGTGTDGYQDGPPATAQIEDPSGIAIDASGNVYFSDQQGQLIREILFSGGNIVTVAGTLTGVGNSPPVVDPAAQDGMPALGAVLGPSPLAISGGNLYFTTNGAIRLMNLATNILGTVVALTPEGFSGDGGPALCAQITSAAAGVGTPPNILATDAAGDLLIADGKRIRLISNPANAPAAGPVAVQITANPDFLSFSVDNTSFSAPQNFQWIPASSHAFSASATQISGPVTYSSTLVSASTGVTVGSTITGPYCSTTYTAQYSSSSSCDFSIAPYDSDQQDFTLAGGTGVMQVTAADSTCVWSVTGLPSWITAPSTSFQGTGIFTYTVQANAGGPRSAVVSVAGFPITVAQPCGASCGYSLSPTGSSPTSAAGQGSVTVTCSAQTCAWTAASNVPWITVAANSGGTGNGSVTYSVAANTGAARVGTLTIAGQTFTVNQGAAAAITIQTVPAGLQFTVDGGAVQTAPETIGLSAGTHTLAVAATQTGAGGASSGTQYVFTSWSDGGGASDTITVGSSTATYTATFQTQYQLTISASPAAGGTVTPMSGGFYDAGSAVPIAATPASGYQFNGWTGNIASSASASTTVTMSAPETVVGNFSSLSGITIQTSPPGLQFSVDSGTLQTAPETLMLSQGSHTIAVAATQAGGAGTQYVFTSWSDGGAISHTITVGSSSAAYTATFQTQYQLTISASPASGGTVTPASGGFYDAASTVAITAAPASGYQFSSWTGSVASGASASTTVTMSAPETVVANFSSLSGITIQTSPPGLQFSVDGGTLQTAPETLTLSQGSHTIAVAATQAGGAGTQYVFTSWSDGGAISHAITVGSSTATYTATFQTQYQLTISGLPAAGGTVTPPSGSFYNAATVVAIAATPASGYQFSSWTGSVASGTSASTTVTMSAPETVVANFASGQAPAAVTVFAPGQDAIGVSLSTSLTWGASAAATSYDVAFGTSANPPFVTNTTNLTYSPALAAGTTYYWSVAARNAFGATPSAVWSFTTAPATSGLRFVPVTPCRIMDTRNAAGTFGGPALPAGGTRDVPVPQSACGIPSTAQAYSLNITVVPPAALSYLTVWPTGETQPNVSTLNSYDGRVVANAAIVPAGTGASGPGSITVYASDATNVIIDINGYFAPASTAGSLGFYPATPCRVVDTRDGTSAFGGPFLSGGSTRSFAIPSSSCDIPATAQAYALNVTVVPHTDLEYLTIWPTGQAQPYVSTLNSLDGTVVANAAIVPAGPAAGQSVGPGAVSVYATNDTDVIIDINGYFAPPATGALSFYAATPCRVADTRGGSGPFGGPSLAAGSTRNFPIPASACAIPSTAQAYALNVTAVPPGPLTYLTAWPAGQSQPVVSTLNSYQGQVVANAAIVPAGTSGSNAGAISVFVSNTTDLILDINGYFGQ